MANEKRLIDANKLLRNYEMWIPQLILPQDQKDKEAIETCIAVLKDHPTVDAVEVPCRCCDCYYLLNGKNSFGLYFFCGHQNGLKNLKNTEKDFCMYGKRRYENEDESDA